LCLSFFVKIGLARTEKTKISAGLPAAKKIEKNNINNMQNIAAKVL